MTQNVPLFIMLTTDEHEKVQMAAMTASVAAVSERNVEVFVSMNAIKIFRIFQYCESISARLVSA